MEKNRMIIYQRKPNQILKEIQILKTQNHLNNGIWTKGRNIGHCSIKMIDTV